MKQKAEIHRVNGQIEKIECETTYDYLKSVIGGWIEIYHLDESICVLMNENGISLNLPININGSKVYQSYLAKKFPTKNVQDCWLLGDIIIIDPKLLN